MPTLAWTAPERPSGDAFVFASRLPLARRRATVRFLRDAAAIHRHLTELGRDPVNGLLWYSLRADPLRNVYATASAWRDGDSMAAFARSDLHRSIVARHRTALGTPTFTSFAHPAAAVPIEWAELDRRLAAAEHAEVGSPSGG